MPLCPRCQGQGGRHASYGWRECSLCKGQRFIKDPQIERLISLVERIAVAMEFDPEPLITLRSPKEEEQCSP